jgi:hypothetical protein
MDEVVSPGEEAPEAAEAVSLLEKIAANPYDYNSHVAYITLLRKLGIGEDLRQAREVFHSFFPLSEGMLPTCCLLCLAICFEGFLADCAFDRFMAAMARR